MLNENGTRLTVAAPTFGDAGTTRRMRWMRPDQLLMHSVQVGAPIFDEVVAWADLMPIVSELHDGVES